MSTDIQDMNDEINLQLEEEVEKQLLVLEKEFREHHVAMKKELQLQYELVERIRVLSQRCTILESGDPHSRYTEIYKSPAQDNLLQEFNEKLKQIRNSNCRISRSLSELRKSCNIFESLCSQLDMKTETPLIIGDTFHKPIAHFIELVSDLFKYFHAWILKLRYLSHQFDPFKIESIKSYKKHLEPSEDFEEYLNVGLTYCKCLRTKRKC